MTTATIHAPAHRYGLAQTVRAEWTKLFSLRSTYWTLLVTLAGSLLVTVLTTNSAGGRPPGAYQGFDPTNQALSGLLVAVLTMGVLGALAVTGEYASGTMRATLSAAPRRPLLLAAKATVVGVVALVAGEVVSLACFTVGQVVLAHNGAPTASLAHSAVLRAVTLSGAYLALLALAGLGVGLVLRHTAGALATYAGFTFLLTLIVNRIAGHADRFTPLLMLANSVAAARPQGDAVAPVTGCVLMGLYTVVLLALGGALLARRDA